MEARVKLIASGDHHWDETSRWQECERIHAWQADLVERERPDLYLSAGDIYERRSTPRERAAVASWLERVAAVCPVVIAKGNHDRHLDCALLARLRTRHPVIVEEAADVHVIGGAAVAAMAWPDRGRLLAMLGRDATSATADEFARGALQDVLRGLGRELEQYGDHPCIGLGHWMIDGSQTSHGQPLIGQPMNVALSELALLGAPLVIAGHVHKPQRWSFGNSEILYTGSPFRTAFGELEEKSVVLAEFDGPRLVRCDRVSTPATKMILLEAMWDDGALRIEGGLTYDHGGEEGLRGAEVRLRYEVASDQRDAARIAASALKAEWLDRYGALRVQTEEEVIATVRARAPEVAAATTVADKLRALWRARGEDFGEARERRLLTKVAELDTEAA